MNLLNHRRPARQASSRSLLDRLELVLDWLSFHITLWRAQLRNRRRLKAIAEMKHAIDELGRGLEQRRQAPPILDEPRVLTMPRTAGHGRRSIH